MTRYDDTSLDFFSQQSTVSFVVSQVTEEQRLMQIDLCKIRSGSDKIKESSDKIKESSDKIKARSDKTGPSLDLGNAVEIEELKARNERGDFDSDALKLRRENELNGLKEDSESHIMGDLNSNCVPLENPAESVV